jgi:D-alanyl-D-alanine endopeptidase (penicillin-binding protein 7)
MGLTGILGALLIQSAHGAVTAKSYIVVDMDGNVLAEKQADTVRPIASITKLITTENAIKEPDEWITITRADFKGPHTRTTLRVGKSYRRSELIDLSLVASDNVAAAALGRTTPIVSPPDINIVEPTGRSRENQASARVLAEHVRHLHNTDLAAISVQPFVVVDNKTRTSTNPMILKQGWEFALSKTGFTNPAGGCLIVITRIKEQLVTVVILGARDTRARWRDLAELRVLLGDSDFENAPSQRNSRKNKQLASLP